MRPYQLNNGQTFLCSEAAMTIFSAPLHNVGVAHSNVGGFDADFARPQRRVAASSIKSTSSAPAAQAGQMPRDIAGASDCGWNKTGAELTRRSQTRHACDYSQQHSGCVGNYDWPIALFLEKSIHQPQCAVDRGTERLDRASLIPSQIILNLKNIRYIHANGSERSSNRQNANLFFGHD